MLCPVFMQISADTHDQLGQLKGEFTVQDAMAIKGKGLMTTYLLREDIADQLRQEGLRQAAAALGTGHHMVL